MEYVFELDVSGKVEDVVETLLQVIQCLARGIYWAENSKQTSAETSFSNCIFTHFTETLISYKYESDLLDYVKFENCILGRSHTYIRSNLNCY